MSPEADLLRNPLGAVVVGPEIFAAALAAQGVAVRRVDWRPSPAAGELGTLWCDAVDAANRVTLERILTAHQVLVDVRPARRRRLGRARAGVGGVGWRSSALAFR